MSNQELAMQLSESKGSIQALFDIIRNLAMQDNKREANSCGQEPDRQQNSDYNEFLEFERQKKLQKQYQQMQQFQQQTALQPPQKTQAITGPTQTLQQGQFTNQQPQKDYSSVMVARQLQMNPLGQVDQRIALVKTNVLKICYVFDISLRNLDAFLEKLYKILITLLATIKLNAMPMVKTQKTPMTICWLWGIAVIIDPVWLNALVKLMSSMTRIIVMIMNEVKIVRC
uniref:Uncharacterized protein n=1 Tax=Romanomermis culicivorax TaxID=13658 RepID=A0A915K1L5_ROMCU